MRDWLPYRDAFLETIISLEGPKDRRTCTGCSAYSSPWRCIDCLDFPSLCTACCLKRHEHDFLHRIEKWTPAKVNSDQAGGRESGDSAPTTEDHAGSDDEDEDDAMKTRMRMRLHEAKTMIEKPTCPSHLLQSKGRSILTKVGCT